MTARRNFPWLGLRVMVFLTYAFMLGPILITAAVSFNAASRSKFPPVGFSLRWWATRLLRRAGSTPSCSA